MNLTQAYDEEDSDDCSQCNDAFNRIEREMRELRDRIVALESLTTEQNKKLKWLRARLPQVKYVINIGNKEAFND